MKPPTDTRSHSRRELLDRVRHRAVTALETGPGNAATPDRIGRQTHMRRAEKVTAAGPTKALPTPPSAAIIALNRLGFGPRGDDIPTLAEHFCRTIGQTYGRTVTLSPEALGELCRYPWPGNVRELRNVIERALLLTPGPEIGPGVFAGLLGGVAEEPVPTEGFRLPEGGIDLAELERDLIRQALERTEGNRTQAARLLGLSRDTLRYRLRATMPVKVTAPPAQAYEYYNPDTKATSTAMKLAVLARD